MQEAVRRALSRIQRVFFVLNIREPESGELRAVVDAEVVEDFAFFVEDGDEAVLGGFLVVEAGDEELAAGVHGQGGRSQAS